MKPANRKGMKKAHSQIAALSMASLLLLSLFSVLLINPKQESGVTGFALKRVNVGELR
jgi:hypothetical protein